MKNDYLYIVKLIYMSDGSITKVMKVGGSVVFAIVVPTARAMEQCFPTENSETTIFVELTVGHIYISVVGEGTWYSTCGGVIYDSTFLKTIFTRVTIVTLKHR